MDRNEILERLADKVKKEGQIYTPPIEECPTHSGYVLLNNEYRIILEEEYCAGSINLWIKQLSITKKDDFESGKITAHKLYWPCERIWHMSATLRSRNVTDGFKSIDEFLASLC